VQHKAVDPGISSKARTLTVRVFLFLGTVLHASCRVLKMNLKNYRFLEFSHLRIGVHFGKLIIYFSYANKINGQIQRDKKRMG
jgi:hypothetical protein